MRMNVTLALQTVTFNCKFANAEFIATVPNWKSALISQHYGNVGIASAVTVAVKSHLRRGESYAWLEWQKEPSGDCACSERTKQANQPVASCSIHVLLISECDNADMNERSEPARLFRLRFIRLLSAVLVRMLPNRLDNVEVHGRKCVDYEFVL